MTQEELIITTRLSNVLATIAISEPTEPPTDDERVHVGSIVVMSKDGGKPETYIFIGANEPEGVWSRKEYRPVRFGTPVGLKLLGQEIGSDFSVEVKGKETCYEVIAIGTPDEPADQAAAPMQIPVHG